MTQSLDMRVVTCYIGVSVARTATIVRRLESEIKAVEATLLQLNLVNAVFRNQKIKTGLRRVRREEPYLTTRSRSPHQII